ncbi:MAG: hypothetical protein ABEH78_00105 [Haloferacaceae archaeon]
MLDAEWSVEAVAEVALVEVSVHNPTAVDRRVRVENRLDGPTLPPRSEGVPEAGWDADGYTGVVPADGTIRLGYASPATATDPPVVVEDEGRVDTTGDADGHVATGDADAAAAVRLLGDGSPPADALPTGGTGMVGEGASAPGTTRGAPPTCATDAAVTASVGPPHRAAASARAGPTEGDPAPGGAPRRAASPTTADGAPPTDPSAGDGEAGTNGPADGRLRSPADGPSDGGDGALGDDGPRQPPAGTLDADTGSTDSPVPPGDDHGGEGADAETEPGHTGAAEGAELPASVEEWLTDAERRVDHGERLTDASVVEAATVLDERGGFASVADLPDRLTADEAALRALAERATALAERAAATDVPLAALRRLS